jgi:hypothetical protein
MRRDFLRFVLAFSHVLLHLACTQVEAAVKKVSIGRTIIFVIGNPPPVSYSKLPGRREVRDKEKTQ